MIYRYLILNFLLNIQNIITDNNGFICPKDGRWPHPADCEKFYTCNAGVGVEAWCGNGMTYDIDHGRCDLSKNIDCKNGERPNWILPSEWKTEHVTENIILKTTPRVNNDVIEIENEQERTTVIPMKLINRKMLLPTNDIMENNPCNFQGNIPDPDECQSYFTCKDEITTRFQCPDKYLFDEDLLSCNDYRKVFCGNRPTNERGNDPCLGKSNGWYADYDHQCRLYYLCTDQRQTKTGECPVGSKWNLHRLQCDDPRYIAAPCGYRSHNNASLLLFNYINVFLVNTIIYCLFFS
ncbi:unnamed protein product [Adineta steineri]|uniref:Chitin-binding type-2 domain-containing protein n=1 Tax=Adineta steineri TaxID=433720 RepID=A0A813N6C3_9BILA|nr:unnamed protein product [Adineta steineri]CAF3477154.1 unnamed protein product [Adineta steineri]